jgi:hypothetical protein
MSIHLQVIQEDVSPPIQFSAIKLCHYLLTKNIIFKMPKKRKLGVFENSVLCIKFGNKIGKVMGR